MTGAVFQPTHTGNGLFDLLVNGRTRDVDLAPEEFGDALRRARLPSDTRVLVEDESGARQRLTR